jgi:hypothetical protein
MPIDAPTSVPYTPNSRNEFAFNKISKKLQKYGYKSVCFDKPTQLSIYTCLRNKLDYNKYVGKKGYFTEMPPIENGGYIVKEAILETGEKLYLFAPESKGVTSRYIVPLKQYIKENNFQATHLVQGSNVFITGYDNLGMGQLKVSSQSNHSFSEVEIEAIRKIAKQYPSKQGRIADLLSTLSIEYDDFDQVTLIHSPLYNNKTSSIGIRIIANNNSSLTGMLTVRYESDKWLFVDSFSIAADDYRWQSAKKLSFNRDHGNGKIWEWFSSKLDSLNIPMLEKIATSANSKIRFHGKQYFDDYTLTKEQKSDLNSMIEILKLTNNINK